MSRVPGGTLVLVADSERAARRALAIAFRSDDHAVLCFADGRSLVRTATALRRGGRTVSAVVGAEVLVDMSGFELSEQLAAAIGDTTVILRCSELTEEARVRARAAGVTYLIARRAEITDLRTVLAHAIARAVAGR